LARLSITVSVLVALGTLVPTGARADGRWCEWTSSTLFAERGSLVCYPDGACEADTDCASTPGAEGSDRVCVARSCMPPCSTIRLCDATADDCGVGARCLRISSGRRPDLVTSDGAPFEPDGVCVLTDPSSRDTALPRVLCPEDAPTWDGWERAYVYRHDFGFPIGMRPVHTNAWGFGNPDGDACPNGVDADACRSDARLCSVLPEPPASCGANSGTGACCAIEAGALVCAPNPGACDCSSTIRVCTPGPLAFSEAECPALAPGSGPGTCVRPDQPGALGVCLYPDFLDDCSDLAALDTSRCFVTPRGTVTANFYDGDCDGDGCPNGNDPDRCDACDEATCAVESTDPRTDCHHPGEPLLDPAWCQPDASAAMDAGAGEPRSVRFSGGGCTCRVGARPEGTIPQGVALGATFLAATLLRRRSRRAHPDEALAGLRR
jgi:hypothetical protein